MFSKISQKKDLINFIKKKKLKKIFVISGKNSFYKSEAYKIFNTKIANKKFQFYFKKSYLPVIGELTVIVKLLHRFKPDLIVAIGGGAVLDYAKIAHIANKGELGKLKSNILKFRLIGSSKNCPLLAIPTTAGSGAEVTSGAVIYINKKKFSVDNNLLIPSFFLLIPDFIIKNPYKIKSSSAFDVISQAIESMISTKSNKTSIYYAKKSLKLSYKNYLSFLKSPTKKNCSNMLLAANFSGKAINISKTTAPHALSYPFSYNFNIPHGHAVSLTLEKFLEFNYVNLKKSKDASDLKKKYQIIFRILKVRNISELKNKIIFIKKAMKLNSNLKSMKININKNLNKIMSGINFHRLKNNPVKVYKQDIKKILLDIK
jgi:alcohol dehydrogenase class IV